MDIKKPLIVALCLGMGACHTISGTLSVTGNNFQLKDKKGNLVSIPTGNANVVMENGKLLLKAQNTSGKKDTVELDSVGGVSLPAFQEGGEHKFLASATGQPVDIDEITVNSTSESPHYTDWESCSTTITVEVPCPTPTPQQPPANNGGGDHPTPPAQGGGDNHPGQGGGQPGQGGDHGGKPGDNGHGKQAKVFSFKALRKPASGDHCTASRVVTGRQQVEFHYDGDSFEIQLIMTNPSTGESVATFDGTSSSSTRITDRYLTPCFTDGPGDRGDDHGPGHGRR